MSRPTDIETEPDDPPGENSQNQPPPDETTEPDAGRQSVGSEPPAASEADERPTAPAEIRERPGSRWRAALLRLATAESTLVVVGGLLIAVVLTWPTLKHPATTVPQDVYDPLLIAWELAWGGHAVLHDFGSLWQSNTLFPEPNSFAFTDSLLGYAPLGFFGHGVGAALVRYNVAYVLSFAISSMGGYALVRRLGSSWPGALVAGLAVGYAPWKLGQAGHLHVISTGGIALALAALAKGHGWSLTRGYRPEEARPGWAAAGWALACWQITIGFGIGLPFGYVLGGVGVAAIIGWFVTGRPEFARRLLFADVFGGLAFLVVAGLMARPYLQVVADHPYARRTEADLSLFSPPLRGFLTAPETSWLWGEASARSRGTLLWAPEMTMLPGVFLIVLAIAGLALSIWSKRSRLWLGIGTAVSLVLAMGTTFFGGVPGYLLLYRYLPGWDAIRTPGRLVIWTTLLLAILAAGAVTGFGNRLAAQSDAAQHDRARLTRWPRWVVMLALVPALLVAAEGINTTPHPDAPAEPESFRHLPGPALVLPSDSRDQWVMLWSTDGFPKVVNGVSGFTPHSQELIRQAATAFPSTQSIQWLRQVGLRYVLVIRQGELSAVGTPYQRALTTSTNGMPLRRTDRGDGVLFQLLAS